MSESELKLQWQTLLLCWIFGYVMSSREVLSNCARGLLIQDHHSPAALPGSGKSQAVSCTGQRCPCCSSSLSKSVAATPSHRLKVSPCTRTSSTSHSQKLPKPQGSPNHHLQLQELHTVLKKKLKIGNKSLYLLVLPLQGIGWFWNQRCLSFQAGQPHPCRWPPMGSYPSLADPQWCSVDGQCYVLPCWDSGLAPMKLVCKSSTSGATTCSKDNSSYMETATTWGAITLCLTGSGHAGLKKWPTLLGNWANLTFVPFSQGR